MKRDPKFLICTVLLIAALLTPALSSCSKIADAIREEFSPYLPQKTSEAEQGGEDLSFSFPELLTSDDHSSTQTFPSSSEGTLSAPTDSTFSTPSEQTATQTPTDSTVFTTPDEPTPPTTESETPEPSVTPTGDSIPFKSVPDFPEYTMPEEQFSDQLDREASLIIDGAICRAIATVNVVRDGRHSDLSFPYTEDVNGYASDLTAQQKKLYEELVAHAENFDDFKIEGGAYAGDLLSDALTVARPISLVHPDVESYFTIKPADMLSSIVGEYFDPHKDGNASVRSGEASLSQVQHDVQLMKRIVRRIVEKMPEGLTTYDKYFYLASVLCEHCVYDTAPDNKFTAFGALVDGRCVCEGYSGAYLLLCREADLWCAYRAGVSKGEGHIWNMVKLESGIYNVDVTWCDARAPHSKSWYDFFMKSDSDFVKDGHGATDGVKGTGVFEPNPYQEA